MGFALAHALVAAFGEAVAYAIAGGALLAIALLLLAFMALSRPRKPPPTSELTKVLLAAVAKETPWLAIVGAGLASAAKMFLNRNKSPNSRSAVVPPVDKWEPVQDRSVFVA